MRVCLENDSKHIFEVQDTGNGVFSDQAVQNFQRKILRAENNSAKTDEKNVKNKLERATSAVERL